MISRVSAATARMLHTFKNVRTFAGGEGPRSEGATSLWEKVSGVMIHGHSTTGAPAYLQVQLYPVNSDSKHILVWLFQVSGTASNITDKVKEAAGDVRNTEMSLFL